MGTQQQKRTKRDESENQIEDSHIVRPFDSNSTIVPNHLHSLVSQSLGLGTSPNAKGWMSDMETSHVGDDADRRPIPLPFVPAAVFPGSSAKMSLSHVSCSRISLCSYR